MTHETVTGRQEERRVHLRFVPPRAGVGSGRASLLQSSLHGNATRAYVPEGYKPRLLDQVRGAIRMRHSSYRTEKAYVGWIKRFIVFPNKRLVALAN